MKQYTANISLPIQITSETSNYWNGILLLIDFSVTIITIIIFFNYVFYYIN